MKRLCVGFTWECDESKAKAKAKQLVLQSASETHANLKQLTSSRKRGATGTALKTVSQSLVTTTTVAPCQAGSSFIVCRWCKMAWSSWRGANKTDGLELAGWSGAAKICSDTASTRRWDDFNEALRHFLPAVAQVFKLQRNGGGGGKARVQLCFQVEAIQATC
jgi:hypothetical protein